MPRAYRIRRDSLLSCLFLFILLACGACSGPAHAQPLPQNPLERKNVLILHSSEANAPAFVATDKGLLDTLRSGEYPA